MTDLQPTDPDRPDTDTTETVRERRPGLQSIKKWERLKCTGCGSTYFGGARAMPGTRHRACPASPAGRFR